MSKQTIRVVAQVIARTDKIPEIQAILQNIVAPTRQETGCLSYQLLRHSSNPAAFLFIEEWTDENAVDAHFRTAHIQEALAKAAPWLAQAPDIQRYTLLA
ncbi:MAG: antibiotic biosynthesis monooxygenase [Gammaproteobacteria bacterium]|nr:MAG: antibiotic biosynthesis monooxygenase [Gammaproteobacteria bacterium]